jgi:hypothetical protein
VALFHAALFAVLNDKLKGKIVGGKVLLVAVWRIIPPYKFTLGEWISNTGNFLALRTQALLSPVACIPCYEKKIPFTRVRQRKSGAEQQNKSAV